ncbi:PHD protein [Geosmithia morbida]|uniref:PHD protein n=1 Tax=Geosmithia morbida TaxID=1094350 RepID=A0A9P4YPX3_9HYPO|nr:PHD protein [Geosmithia morbida]KAF4120953.1 PHD protein [Geosmithia morbida]
MCRITISDVSFSRPKVLHCQSQSCVIVTFRNPADPHRVARVELPRPFYIPRESLMIKRPDDATYDFGDSYKVLVEIEPTDGIDWPPLNLEDLTGIPSLALASSTTQNWSFSSPFDRLFGRLKAPLSLVTASYMDESTYETDYELDVDLQWSSGTMESGTLEDDSKELVTEDSGVSVADGHWGEDVSAGDNHQTAAPYENQHGIDDINGGKRTPSRGPRTHKNHDGTNGDHTPSRGLRTRGGDKNYNLKTLSDMAHGKQRKPGKSGMPMNIDGGRVHYFLPPDEPVCVDGFRCLSHSDYDYKLETTVQGPRFHVSNREDSPDSPSKSFSFCYPQRSFNFETFVAGDQLLEPSHLDDIGHGSDLAHKANSANVAPSGKHTLKQSDKTRASTKTCPRKEATTIPPTRNIFYHPVSKQELKVGDEVPKPVVEKQWFHHKHHHNLDDVVDVTAAELEYIKEFDDVMREQDISAQLYFPRAWLRFVKEKASWLIEANYRMQELGMHESYLVATGLINIDHIQEAAGYIGQARARRDIMGTTSKVDGGQENKNGTSRRSPEPADKMIPVGKSASGCSVCGLPVLNGPRTLICSNKKCLAGRFHSQCVSRAPTTRAGKLSWQCSECRTTIDSARTTP